MSSANETHSAFLWPGIRTGAAGFFILMGLLAACALLIWRGVLSEELTGAVIPAAAFGSGLLTGVLGRKGGEEGGLLRSAVGAGCLTLLALLMLSGMKNTHILWRTLLPVAALFAGGDLLGSAAGIRKKHRRKHYQKKKYNR